MAAASNAMAGYPADMKSIVVRAKDDEEYATALATGQLGGVPVICIGGDPGSIGPGYGPREQRTTRIKPMSQDLPLEELQRHYSRQELEAVAARAKDKRGTAAKLRLAQQAQSQVAAVDRKVAQLVRTHNHTNKMAVERGRVQDLPYLEQLVDSMRSKGSPLDGKGARQQRKMLQHLMKETEARNTGALTDLIMKACGCTKVKRKPSADWFICSALNVATEYILYKSKAKDAFGHAQDYGFVIVCYNKRPADDAKEEGILSVMQRGDYLEAMLIYTCLECLLNFELASELLARVQKRECDDRTDMADSKYAGMFENLMALEDDLAAFAEANGTCKALRCGDSLTSFDIKGAIADNPEPLMAAVLNISEQLQALLKSISQALRPAPAPEAPKAVEEAAQ